MKCVVCEERPQGDPLTTRGSWCLPCTRLFDESHERDETAWAARRARELERESCAKDADLHAEILKHTSHCDGIGFGDHRGEAAAHTIAAAIRARSNKGGG